MKKVAAILGVIILAVTLSSGFAHARRGGGYGPGAWQCAGGKGGWSQSRGAYCPGPGLNRGPGNCRAGYQGLAR